jgi:ubiquitin-like domain-containing CTD phosphatase 1
MFKVISTKLDGSKVQHHVKPLQIIWSKFPDRWGAHNTVHIDDLSRNFALNLGNGLQCTPYHRKKKKNTRSSSSSSRGGGGGGRNDTELLHIGKYLIHLVESSESFNVIDFTKWMDVAIGRKQITETKKSK